MPSADTQDFKQNHGVFDTLGPDLHLLADPEVAAQFLARRLEHFGVPCLSLEEFMEEEGWEFRVAEVGDFSDVVLESVVTEGEIVTIYDIKLPRRFCMCNVLAQDPPPGAHLMWTRPTTRTEGLCPSDNWATSACPLVSGNQTYRLQKRMSANDPKRTSA